MTKEITPKERERILIRMLLILFAIFIIAIVVTITMPTEQRLLPFIAVISIGLFCSGIYASKRFARNYEEFIWGITGFLTVCIMFGAIFFQYSIGVVQCFFSPILSIFLLWLPLTMIISFSAFEILFSIKIKKPLSFHLKRFTGRMMLTGIVVVFVATISSVINLLAPFMPEKYLATTLIFGYLLTSVALYILVKNPKIRRFFSKLEKGEW